MEDEMKVLYTENSKIRKLFSSIDPLRIQKLLLQFLKIPSPTGKEREFSEFYARELKKAGFKVKIDRKFAGSPNVIAGYTWSKQGLTIQLDGHTDAIAKSHPEPFFKTGIVYGRGACDMKGALTAMVESGRILIESGYNLKGSLMVTAHGLHEAPLGTNETLDDLIIKKHVGDAVIVWECAHDMLPVEGNGLSIFEIIVKRKGPVMHDRYLGGIRMNRKLKVGVFGAKRGAYIASLFEKSPKVELKAICDFDRKRVNKFLETRKGVTAYEKYDRFLEHEIDVVIICNYGTEHVPYAIKALKSGKHVFSEVIACKTLAEGAALCRAVETSGKKYMFSENYCYLPYAQEMAWLYSKGVIGEYLYGECEYVHDTRPQWPTLTNGPGHWRNWLPSTYYCTHSIGPILTITKTRPIKVSGFVVPNKISREVGRVGDDWGILMCHMDNQAITRVISWSTGPHDSIWYRVHGTKGAVENNRWRNTDTLNLFVQKDLAHSYEKSYLPEFRRYKAQAKKTGHGGSDFFVVNDFIQSIIKDQKPPIDVYMAMDMTLPGILGYRSALKGSVPLEVPDFRKEKVRKKYQDDNWSPDPKDRNTPGQPPPSILGKIRIPNSIHEKIEKERTKQGISLKKLEKSYKEIK